MAPDITRDLHDLTTTQLEGALAGAAPAEPELIAQMALRDARAALFQVYEHTPKVGRFLVLSTLGMGGMGCVFEAYDPHLERKIAVKVIRSEDSRLRAALLCEARSMARLTHPNVVSVYEVTQESEQLCIAMELVKGVTLRKWLQKEPSLREICRVLASAGRGLCAAHEAGLIHGDFKPENVLVGDDGRVRVADFGLAGQRRDATGADGADQERAFGCTPAYAAPEVLGGHGRTARSDQFSFCVCLYEALSGTRPGFSPDGTPQTDGVPKTVPAKVVRLLKSGLALRATERNAGLGALIDALEGVARGSQKRWGAVVVASVLLFAIGAAFGLQTSGSDDIEAKRCVKGQARLDSVWNAVVQTDIRSPGGVAAKQHLSAYVNTWRTENRQACEATYVHKVQSVAELDERLQCLSDTSRDFEAIVQEIVRNERSGGGNLPSLELARSLSDPGRCHDEQVLQRYNNLDVSKSQRHAYEELNARLSSVYAATEARRFQEADALSQTIVFEARKLGVDDLLGEALYRRGVLELELRRPSAESLLREAVMVSDRAGDDHTRAYALSDLYTDVSRKGEVAKADVLFAMAQGAAQRIRGDNLLSNLLDSRGADLHYQGRDREAVGYFERAIELRKRAWGDRSPLVARALVNLGLARRGLQELDGALAAWEEAEAIYKETLPPTDVSFATLWTNMSTVYGDRHDYEKVAELSLGALAVKEQHAVGEEVVLVPVLINLGTALVLKGQPKEGAPHLERAMVIVEKLVRTHPYRPYALSALALARLELGASEEAKVLLQESLAHHLAHPGDKIELAFTRFVLARALRNLDQAPRRARNLASLALATYREAKRPVETREILEWLGEVATGSP